MFELNLLKPFSKLWGFFRLVIDTLQKVDKDRKCFRLVGGVLVERKVAEVEPALVGNREKVHLNVCIQYALPSYLFFALAWKIDREFGKTVNRQRRRN